MVVITVVDVMVVETNRYFIITRYAPFIRVKERCSLEQLKDNFLKNKLEDNIYLPNPVEVVAVGRVRPYLGEEGLPYKLVTKSGIDISIRSKSSPFEILKQIEENKFPDLIFYDTSEILLIFPITPSVEKQNVNEVEELSKLLKQGLNK